MKGLVLLSAFCFALLLCGCETNTNYKVLSFFFDGVPKPEQTKSVKGQPGQAEAESRGSVHGPYAAGQCSACHQRGTNVLVAPIREICLNCHRFNMEKRSVHGPLASGGCIFCHVPHSSDNPFLLKPSLSNACIACHNETAIRRAEYHQVADLRCTNCHDAHMSDKPYLLK
ncbi:MAG TPA: cytochrome c3 family protein [Thermodesulfovibrionales bacterium]|nr:cytochrome c3 family protein [Thermodesulfovibrionales bacterium]